MERVGADDLVRHLLGGFRQRPAPDRLLVGGEIGLGHPVHLLPVRVREPGEEAFAQDVVDLARVQVDRGDGLRAAAGLLLEVRELPAQDPARLVIGGVQGGDHDHAALELHRRGEQVGDRVFQEVEQGPLADRLRVRHGEVRGELVEHDQGGPVPDQPDPVPLAHLLRPVDPVIPELLGLTELLGDVPPDEVPDVPAVHRGDHGRLVAHPGGDRLRELVLQLREPGQEAEGDHVVGLTAPHRLAQLEDRLLALAGEASQGAAEELGHAGGHVVAGVE